VIGETTPEPSGDDKTSLVFATQDRPGALHHQLEILARNSVNMTRIESRPSKRGLWEYLFFIDIEGHQSEELLSRVLSELHTEAAFFKMLGSYPRRVA
jgi:chorismate mutase/prephenate dehydratase